MIDIILYASLSLVPGFELEDTDFLAAGSVNLISQSVAGSITPTGAVTPLVDVNSQDVAGSITPTGELVFLDIGIEGFGGSITPEGSVATQIDVNIVENAGGISPTGDLGILVGLTLGGGITPQGSSPAPTHLLHTSAGVITPTGAIVANDVLLGGSGHEIIHKKKKKLL